MQMTKSIGFGTNLSRELHLVMKNVEIEHVEVTKLLGVTLDCKLSWSKHIDTSLANMGRSLSIMKCYFAFLTMLSTSQVLQAVVLSHLDCCSVVWSGENCSWLRTGQHGWPLKVQS